MKTAKVFRLCNSQAGRLPKKITLEQLDSILGAFRGRFVRRQPRMQKRCWR